MKIFEKDGVTLIDVSHVVEDGMITYKGLPAPIICDYLSRESSKEIYGEGASFQIGTVTMSSNTGTYIDVPFHRYAEGKDLSEIELDKLANLDAIRIDIPTDVNSIEIEHLQSFRLNNRAVLLNTGWSRHWRTDRYFEGHPFVSEAAANYLREQGALLVGIDSHNIDDISKNTRPCHSILLKAEIPICEHMTNLTALPNDGFRFFAVPVKMKGMGTFPVRAFGLIK